MGSAGTTPASLGVVELDEGVNAVAWITGVDAKKK